MGVINLNTIANSVAQPDNVNYNSVIIPKDGWYRIRWLASTGGSGTALIVIQIEDPVNGRYAYQVTPDVHNFTAQDDLVSLARDAFYIDDSTGNIVQSTPETTQVYLKHYAWFRKNAMVSLSSQFQVYFDFVGERCPVTTVDFNNAP